MQTGSSSGESSLKGAEIVKHSFDEAVSVSDGIEQWKNKESCPASD